MSRIAICGIIKSRTALRHYRAPLSADGKIQVARSGQWQSTRRHAYLWIRTSRRSMIVQFCGACACTWYAGEILGFLIASQSRETLRQRLISIFNYNNNANKFDKISGQEFSQKITWIYNYVTTSILFPFKRWRLLKFSKIYHKHFRGPNCSRYENLYSFIK